MTLRERFKRDLFPHIPPEREPQVDALFTELEGLYSASDRKYHGLGHIENCLEAFDFVNHGALLRMDILAAIYYHDAIYDSTAKDNEERSAELADVRLREAGFSADFCKNLRRTILGTKHTGGLITPSEQIMADVDLSELAVDWKTFDENTWKIRQEYGWVSDADFRKGRAAFFKGMLARERIYYTRPFHFLFEARARENMQCSVDELTA